MDTNALIGYMFAAIIGAILYHFIKNQTGGAIGHNGPEAERRAQVTK